MPPLLPVGYTQMHKMNLESDILSVMVKSEHCLVLSYFSERLPAFVRKALVQVLALVPGHVSA